MNTGIDNTLDRIREIRIKENITLKSSSYLKKTSVDEYGDEKLTVLRNYQKQMVLNCLMLEKFLCGDDTGLGKAQPIDSAILTPSGWVNIGSIRVGDYIIGQSGRPVIVVGVFPQGIKQTYSVTMSDGSNTECCDEHLWAVRTGNTRRSEHNPSRGKERKFLDGWRILSLKQIMTAGLIRQRNSNGLKWSIPMVAPIAFEEKKLPVDPYLLGVLLGDGSMPGSVRVTNGDPDLFGLIENRFPPDLKFGSRTSDGLTVNLVWKPGVRNSLNLGLRKLDLMGKNWTNKFIPKEYLFGSIAQRIDLLRGLMDTDGYVSADGMITQFYSSNLTLVNDFIHLVQSLGGTATVKSKMPTLRGKSRAKKGRLAHTVTISLSNEIIPFSLPRKVARWVPRKKYHPARRIAKIESSREIECVCIKVDAKDSLYVTDDFIVTHNTIEILAAIGYIWDVEPDYVPIVITTKSALFQWMAETQRFMQNMEAIPAFGEPFERQIVYEGFFLKYNSSKKRLLLITYDTVMRDLEPSVIRDRSVKVPAALKRELKAARKQATEEEQRAKAEENKFDVWFQNRIFDVHEYIRDQMLPEPEGRSIPPGWTVEDGFHLNSFRTSREKLIAIGQTVQKLADQAAPPKKVPGILDYVQSLKATHSGTRFMLVMDEMHKLKNHKSQFHQKVQTLSLACRRVYGMTATPVKNRLMEFWSLFRIIKPDLFPKITHFQNEFCITKLQSIGGGRMVPIVVGYKNLDEFVRRTELYYLSRKKHEVAKELPQLLSREVECELYELQEELYDMSEAGLMQDMDDPDASGGQILASMTMIQQAVNSPALLANEDDEPFEGPSSKIDALLELLLDEAEGQKVIVFSRFEKMISLIGKTLEEVEWKNESGRKHKGIKYVRITGKENDPKVREAAKNKFQDMKSGTNVILITTAGAESLNLQSAEHFVFIDLPWSWGDYLQLIGRMIRIGSSYITVVAHHFLARKRDGKKTIDHNVYKALKDKKKLADKVAGDALKDGLVFSDKDVVKDVMVMMRQGFDRKAGDRGTLLAEMNAKIASGKPSKISKLKGTRKNAKISVVQDDHPTAALELDLTDF